VTKSTTSSGPSRRADDGRPPDDGRTAPRLQIQTEDPDVAFAFPEISMRAAAAASDTMIPVDRGSEVAAGIWAWTSHRLCGQSSRRAGRAICTDCRGEPDIRCQIGARQREKGP
jgi:hypothetical protein